ncbi:MAG TPA: hypothetical protein DCK87_06680 [Desulfotomaculum sp.]|nr:hypothetical protein [Desulfotomaculum sp.]
MPKDKRKFWVLMTVAFMLTGILAGLLGGPVPPVKAQDFTMPNLPPPPQDAFLPRVSVPLDVAAMPEWGIKTGHVRPLATKRKKG